MHLFAAAWLQFAAMGVGPGCECCSRNSEIASPSILTSEQFLAELTTPGLALDIDNTLADTKLQWLKILIREFGSPDPDLTLEQIVCKYRGKFCWGSAPLAER